jgi:hypothetical protein
MDRTGVAGDGLGVLSLIRPKLVELKIYISSTFFTVRVSASPYINL